MLATGVDGLTVSTPVNGHVEGRPPAGRQG